MKKIISLVLALITLLFCLVGCNNSKDIVLTDEDIHTDYAGVYLTLSSVDDSGEHKKFNVVWHNETNKEFTFGEDFYIEILENDEWKSVLTEDMIVESIANLFPAKSTNEKTYSAQYFDLSKEGTYRIRCEFSPGDGKRYNTWVTFEVKKASTDKLDNIQPGGTNVHDAFDIRITRTGWVEGVEFDGCLNLGRLAISSVHHLPLFRFSSLDELNEFKTMFPEGHFDCTTDGDTSFNEKTSDYDAAFFEKNDLFLVSVSAGSGSYRFDVNGVFNDSQYFCIYVNQTNNPEIVTHDEAGWFITLAVPKSATENCTSFDAIMGYGLKHSLTVIDESGHLVDVDLPKEYYAGEIVTLKGQLVYDTYLTFYVDNVRIAVELENVDNHLYYSFVMPSKDITVVCKLVSVSPPPAPQ